MRNWHEAHAEKQSAGDRIADRVAAFIGSWAFIIGQTGVMAVWIVVNTLALFGFIRFDMYPFVFLNLFMSAEAAFATPLISCRRIARQSATASMPNMITT